MNSSLLYKNRYLNYLLKHKSLISIILFSIIFSAAIMFSTLSYTDNSINVSNSVYGDLSSHLSLVRSVSKGDNFIPEYQGFSGEPIRYHFLFYYFAGLLEKIGFRIDYSVNILSTIGLAGLLLSIYLLTYKLSKSKLAGWIAVLMTIFNSSLSWIYFLLDHESSTNILGDLVNSSKYSSIGPFDDRLVSIIWNLNVFTNQRHLAFGFFFLFIAVWGICYSNKKYGYFIGTLIIILMPMLHKAAFLILLIVLGMLFLSNAQKRKIIFICTSLGVILSLPGLLYFNSTGNSGIHFAFGYLYNSTSWKDISITNLYLRWLIYWIFNFGFAPIFAIGGWVTIAMVKTKGNKSFKTLKDSILIIYNFFFCEEHVWGTTALLIFIIGNFVVFGPDLFGANHKFFNFVVFIINIYAGIFISSIFNKGLFGRILSIFLIIFLSLGGIVDLFPLFNDGRSIISDVNKDTTSIWILKNTKPKDVFFNLTDSILPVTLTGRKVFFGWEFFSFTFGYNTDARKVGIQNVEQGILNKSDSCSYFSKNNLKYIIISNTQDSFVGVNINKQYFEDNFFKVNTTNPDYTLYDISLSCN